MNTRNPWRDRNYVLLLSFGLWGVFRLCQTGWQFICDYPHEWLGFSVLGTRAAVISALTLLVLTYRRVALWLVPIYWGLWFGNQAIEWPFRNPGRDEEVTRIIAVALVGVLQLVLLLHYRRKFVN